MFVRFLKKRSVIVLFIIVFLALFLRTYMIQTIPPGLYQDETAIGYNAYSILQTGQDEHGKSFPLYFKSFGDYKLPVYIYLTAGSIAAFGMNEFAVRFPSIFFGVGAILAVYFLIKEVTGNVYHALLGSFLLSINPWHIHFSRAAFEVQVATTCILFGCVFFVYGLRKQVGWLYLIAIIFFMTSLYTYNVTRLLSPVILLFLVSYFRKDLQKLSLQWKSLLAGFALLLVLPFLVSLFSAAGVSSASEGLLLSSDIEAKILQDRSNVLAAPPVIQSFFFNKYLQLVKIYLEHLASTFSPNFFFISGSTHGNHGSGTGMFYLFEIITISCGAVLLFFKERRFRFIYGILFFTVAILALSKEVPHATRGFPLIIPFIVFSSYGLYYISQYISRQKSMILRTIVFLSVIGMITVLSTQYLVAYFFAFPRTYAHSWNSEDQKISHYLQSIAPQVKSIIIDEESRLIYTSLLFYQKYNPTDFQESAVYRRDSAIGYTLVRSFGNYTYQKTMREDIQNNPEAVFVTAQDFGNEFKIKEFAYPSVPVVFAADGKVRTAEDKKIAYRVYSSGKELSTMSTP